MKAPSNATSPNAASTTQAPASRGATRSNTSGPRIEEVKDDEDGGGEGAGLGLESDHVKSE